MSFSKAFSLSCCATGTRMRAWGLPQLYHVQILRHYCHDWGLVGRRIAWARSIVLRGILRAQFRTIDPMKRGSSRPKPVRDRDRDSESKRSKPADAGNRVTVGVVGCSETFDYSEVDDSRHTSDRVLSWFVSPLTHQSFQSDVRDKKHHRSQRHSPTYFAGLFSRASFMELIDRKKLEYEKHIVARKSGSIAVAADESAVDGDAHAAVHHFCRKGIARSQAILKALQEGYAVELLRPQQYGGQLWRLCSWLEEAMGSPSGCNVCLLPPGAVRGDVAHEDSDNFMLQV